jgi:hypothetical protein
MSCGFVGGFTPRINRSKSSVAVWPTRSGQSLMPDKGSVTRNLAHSAGSGFHVAFGRLNLPTGGLPRAVISARYLAVGDVFGIDPAAKAALWIEIKGFLPAVMSSDSPRGSMFW